MLGQPRSTQRQEPQVRDNEQATSIAVDGDATLALAEAVTGKTAVITGNIACLVRNQGGPAEAILALAFNRKAPLDVT